MFVYIIVLNLNFVIQWFAKGIKINWNLFKQNFPPEVFIYLKETNLKVGFIVCQGKIKLFVLIVMNLSAIKEFSWLFCCKGQQVPTNYLGNTWHFVSCKIIDIQVPKDKKLNEEQKSFLSKMFVRFY